MPIPRLVAALPLILSALTSCQSYPFSAERTETLEFPPAVTSIACTTHNGKINIRGAATIETIAVSVILAARGKTQEEADENLKLLEVTHQLDDGHLVLGKAFTGNKDIPTSASFDIAGHADLVPTIETHNGSITISGIHAPIKAKTHNGEVTIDGAGSEIDAETHNGGLTITGEPRALRAVTHNGNVDISALSGGGLGGEIETHNGSINLSTHADTACTIAASTHNGGIRVRRPAEESGPTKSSRRITLGAGGNALSITTHNGSIAIK